MKNLISFARQYGLTFIVFLLVDSVWLGVIAPDFYRRHIGFLLAETPDWTAAALFYLLFIAGLVVFAVRPGLRDASLLRAATRGAFFGLVTYATYDLTNTATVKDWPWIVTVVDLAWGSLLCSAVTWTVVALYRRAVAVPRAD